MSAHRGVMMTCPVATCPAYAFVTAPHDPGLLWLFHVRDMHPELVYSPGEIERRRLERQVKARAN